MTEQEPDWASDQVVVTGIAPQRNIARFIREIGRGGHRRREENIAHFKIPRPPWLVGTVRGRLPD